MQSKCCALQNLFAGVNFFNFVNSGSHDVSIIIVLQQSEEATHHLNLIQTKSMIESL